MTRLEKYVYLLAHGWKYEEESSLYLHTLCLFRPDDEDRARSHILEVAYELQLEKEAECLSSP